MPNTWVSMEEMLRMVGIGMIPDLQFLSIVITENWRGTIFKARLLIRHAASGKKYLYDILEIKKETSKSCQA